MKKKIRVVLLAVVLTLGVGNKVITEVIYPEVPNSQIEMLKLQSTDPPYPSG